MSYLQEEITMKFGIDWTCPFTYYFLGFIVFAAVHLLFFAKV
ncbi:hypothetical protein KNT87_gp221 [Erwinia phage Cronus]|uniref:Uncharacterized protein n=1 Tax=Erwinia phage Cronus TaxID=2163633 RepID=A0A2S1GLS7_9CAUD|nr:hypothetical protein KNT87_gp221 [Erwinia phage Cronus]AWD90348.1 hypothetical protein [Erwinia phage Cronus]